MAITFDTRMKTAPIIFITLISLCCLTKLLLEESGAATEVKDKKEVEMEDPVCITLEYYR